MAWLALPCIKKADVPQRGVRIGMQGGWGWGVAGALPSELTMVWLALPGIKKTGMRIPRASGLGQGKGLLGFGPVAGARNGPRSKS
jgi:hypothetical protein